MPKWNLREDWPQEYLPRTKNNFLIDLFSMPLSGTIAENAFKTINLDVSTKNQKKLVIDIQSSTPVEILAMTHGMVTGSAKKIELTSHTFSVALLNKIMIERQKKEQQCLGDFPISWFKSWIDAGRVPCKIMYENVTGTISGGVKAGDVIGAANLNPANPLEKRVKISIEYEDSKPGDLRFMHPREFFSLLFWQQDCDPVLKKNANSYKHPLLRRMMSTVLSAGVSTPVYPYTNDAKDIIDRDVDEWLGLRPPLRTFQRVKWEHIKEHMRTDYGNGTWTGEDGDVSDRILNPYAHDGGVAGYGIKGSASCTIEMELNPVTGKMEPKRDSAGKTIPKGCAKCNIYAGEILFRSGYRSIVWAGGLCGAGQIPHRLKYLSPKLIRKLTQNTKYLNTSRKAARINFNQTKCTGDLTKATHNVHSVIGKKVAHNKKTVNQAIKDGDVFIIATNSHVPIIHDVKSCSATQIKVRVMHQWSYTNPGYKKAHFRQKQKYADSRWATKPVNNTTIVKVMPGGDPTEEWGQLESNCLRKV